MSNMFEFATHDDTSRLKQIWRVSFPEDPISYINGHFQYNGHLGRTAVIKQQGQIASMFDMIDIQIHSNNQDYKAFYIYAAATLPQYRGQKLMHQLIAEVCDYAKEQGYVAALLIPSSASLFKFYGEQGFTQAINTSQQIVKKTKSQALVTPMLLEDFILHKQAFEQTFQNIVKHSSTLIAHIYRQILFAGGNVVQIDDNGRKEYAIYYKDENNTKLFVQELSSPTQHLQSDVSAICAYENAKKAKVRIPGSEKPYGLAKELSQTNINWPNLYMNTMLD